MNTTISAFHHLTRTIAASEGFSDSFGACCAECAHGRRCASSRDSFGGLTVSSGEIAELDAKIANLVADITTAQASAPEDPAILVSFVEILDFQTRWILWRNEHQTILSQSAIPIIGDTKVAQEFQGHQSEYNEALRAWKAAGQATTATPDISEGPLEGASDTAGKALKIAAVFGGIYLLIQATRK